MAVEMLEEPQIQVDQGVTYHIYAIQHTRSTENEHVTSDEAQEQPQRATVQAKAIGAVAIAPSRMARYEDNNKYPYMIHDIMVVRGVVDGEAVYDKTVSPRGIMGVYKPFYGLRIGIAKRRAAHRVKSVLSA